MERRSTAKAKLQRYKYRIDPLLGYRLTSADTVGASTNTNTSDKIRRRSDEFETR